MKASSKPKGNPYRELLAKAIDQNCGYSSGYHDRFALSWNVSVDWGIPDSDSLISGAGLKALGENYSITPEEFHAAVTPEALEEFATEWDDESNQRRQWDWVLEDMREGVTGADTYRMLRPEIAKRYGLSAGPRFPKKYKRRTDECVYYPAKVEGWVLDDPYRDQLMFDVSWEFAGRQGKHLCLSEFEGRRLYMRAEDLAEHIRQDDDGSYPNWWCQRLVAFIHECDICFDRKMVKQEFEHQVAFRFANDLNDVYEACVKAKKESVERLFWAERDVVTK
jgi:hypothetical protein